MNGNAGRPDQSWQNPKSQWQRNARRTRIALIATGISVFLFPISFQAIKWYFDATTPIPPAYRKFDPIDFVMLAVAWLSAIVTCAVLVRMAYRQKRLTGMVVEREGRVCPWCRIDMSRTAPDDASPTLHCERCESELPETDVVQYWVNHWLNGSAAAEWFEEHHPRRGLRLRRIFKSMEAPQQAGKVQRGWVIFTGGFLLAFATLMYFTVPTIYHVIAMIVPMTAVFFIAGAVHRRYEARVQAGRFCASCHYQLAPEQDAKSICPECASDWSVPGAVYSGKERYSRGEIATLALAALFFLTFWLLLYVGPFSPFNETRWMKTPQLIERVATRGGFLSGEWEELFDRELSDDDRIALAQGLLERRRERETLQREANGWFLDQLADGALPQNLVDEYKAGLLLLSADVPAQVRIGEEIPIRITNVVQYQNVPPFNRELTIVFGGFTGEGLHEPAGRTTKILRDSQFGSEWHIYGSRTRDDPDSRRRDRGPIATITATEPGTLELRARYWTILVPQHLVGMAVEWNDDGTPILPRDVEWAFEQELNASIDVLPAADEEINP